jgi:hypothetical protein
MQIVEVLVAAVVFSAASASSLQLWSQAAVSAEGAQRQALQLERIELDRLQLQAHWRRDLGAEAACGDGGDAMKAVAVALPVPPQLQRELLPSPEPAGVLVRWRVASEPALQRERLFTPAGLGVCQANTPPTAQVEEEVLP